MPSRAIVILDRTLNDDLNPVWHYLLRADVPVSRQAKYAKPGYLSPFAPIAPDSDPDALALVSGAVVESLRSWTVTTAVTLPQVQAGLIAQQQQYQAEIAADPTYSRYGTYWDGTSWHAQGA